MPSSSAVRKKCDSEPAFVFYDPYYEELVRRKKERDKVESRAIPSPRPAARTDMSTSPVPHSYSLHETESIHIIRDEISPEPIHADLTQVDCRAGQVEQLERAMRALYADVDRHKRLLNEALDRESRLAQELRQLRLSKAFHGAVPLDQFKELEVKYQNALKLIDDLNWKLHEFPYA
jgi:hypothetical protein